jgi:NAD(P)-dependent dehydrogenase (short-subunit alcohol dehydrogenase family)
MSDGAPTTGTLGGRVIAITGATGGMGRALALDCVRAGAEVVLVARNLHKLQGLRAELEQLRSGAALMAPLDLERAVARDYDTLAEAILGHYGRLDGLVHCAAILGTLTPMEHYEVPTWCRVLHVNLTAAFALTQVLLPALRRSPDASVIFTSSSVGRIGRANWGAYAVSKFGVEGLVQVLAAELADNSSIRVNAINPGRARTMIRRSAYPAEDLEALPRPESLTGPFLWLLGPQGAGTTGTSIDCQTSGASSSSSAAASAPPSKRSMS